MNTLLHNDIPGNEKKTLLRKWVNLTWLVLIIGVMLGFCASTISGKLCNYLATDFRGYYASALISGQAGLSAVYDPILQSEAQTTLQLRCPDGSAVKARLYVFVPYLPAFVIPFKILPRFDLTTSYAIWSLVNLAIYFFYLYRFITAFPIKLDLYKFLQWSLCFPLLANLILGQTNIVLLVALGEFTLAIRQEKLFWGGVWLSFLLLKPHTLILLLPGLLVSGQRKVLQGFAAGATSIIATSALLVGPASLKGWAAVIRSFASGTFNSIPDMMNTRGLAFNLGRILPDWISWSVAGLITLAIVTLVMVQWKLPQRQEDLSWLMLATLAGTCMVAWHANLYLWITLLPFLLALDLEDRLPLIYLALWAFGPALIFSLVYLFDPDLAQPALASGMLTVNISLVLVSTHRLRKNDKMTRYQYERSSH